ncbi:MAG: hypothetical protein IJG87_06390 [Ruminococcus sp.]|nr:hypothetical protein [Ruminococcus sp.]
MSMFEQLGARPQPVNPMQMLSQIRQNPAVILKQAGLNIPAGMSDPQQIINHLLRSGQVPQARYQQAMQMMSRMRR